MPTIRTRQEPWRDIDVSEAEAAVIGRQGLVLPEDEYPEALAAKAAEPTKSAPRGARTPAEG